MSTYSSFLTNRAYRKLPGEERIDHSLASHITYAGLNLSGIVELTNYRLVFITLSGESGHARAPRIYPGSEIKRFILKLPLGTIRNVEQKSYQGNISLHINCKDLRELVFNLADYGRATGFCENLKAYTFPASSKKPLFAYLYGTKCIENSIFTVDGWDVYNPEEEYHRQNIFTNGWRITKINIDYRLCDTYPAILAVPWEVTDELLVACAPHRSRGRVPVLSWLHPESKASLTRASQPLVGVQGRRSSDDKELVRQLRIANANANHLLIFDARPQVNAIANIGVGGGIENPSFYENVQYMFLNIQNIHAMRAALTKVFEACFPLPDDARWLKQLAESKWLYHVKQIIFAATSVADKIENHKTSVLIHCSDGWDRTAQVTSLAMLMLDPYYRTVRGFEVLVEKEWCSFGHKFAQRTGGPADGGIYLPPNISTTVTNDSTTERPSSVEERSPVFLQFIDCVWQTMQQFPHSFEFNERFLITIMDELYAARFGTFLFNSEMQGRDHGVRERTISLWAFINSDIKSYQNPLYTPAEISGHRVIFPQHALAQLQFWTGYYVRWHPLMRSQEPIARQERALILIMRRFRELTAATQREITKPTPNTSKSDNLTLSRSRSTSSKL